MVGMKLRHVVIRADQPDPILPEILELATNAQPCRYGQWTRSISATALTASDDLGAMFVYDNDLHAAAQARDLNPLAPGEHPRAVGARAKPGLRRYDPAVVLPQLSRLTRSPHRLLSMQRTPRERVRRADDEPPRCTMQTSRRRSSAGRARPS